MDCETKYSIIESAYNIVRNLSFEDADSMARYLAKDYMIRCIVSDKMFEDCSVDWDFMSKTVRELSDDNIPKCCVSSFANMIKKYSVDMIDSGDETSMAVGAPEIIMLGKMAHRFAREVAATSTKDFDPCDSMISMLKSVK